MIINPGNTRAQQHIDYAWAVTGYGAQGASTDYVISLEGTEGGRKMLADKRAFYISASRAKEHVQIYTDGKADWTKAVAAPERISKPRTTRWPRRRNVSRREPSGQWDSR
ncbi:Multifunctional conjugation protein TraI [Citrobacter amalonaticus]|nr:Multifunctional conjugation protein TraI [Citrobacter amalonaticus]